MNYKNNKRKFSSDNREVRYIISYPFGLSDYIKKMLTYALGSVKVEEVLPTYAIITTRVPIIKVKKLPFVSNVYLYIKKFTHREIADPSSQLQWAVERPTLVEELLALPFEFETYRIFGQDGGETISLPKDYRNNLRDKLKCYNRLEFSSTSPDAEIWFIKAKEDFGFCGLKISFHPDYQEILQKGELRPEIAYFLNFFAEPVVDGTLLDAFAGSGAIPISAAKYFEYERIIAADKDVSRMERRFDDEKLDEIIGTKDVLGKIELLELDAAKLDGIGSNSIDRIVTDPPWGIFGKRYDVERLYPRFLKSSAAKLKKHGKTVLLVSPDIVDIIAESDSYDVEEIVDLFIWGRDAKAVRLGLAGRGRR
jgi:predicted RNA methylase